jgi:hypothetical protein
MTYFDYGCWKRIKAGLYWYNGQFVRHVSSNRWVVFTVGGYNSIDFVGRTLRECQRYLGRGV